MKIKMPPRAGRRRGRELKCLKLINYNLPSDGTFWGDYTAFVAEAKRITVMRYSNRFYVACSFCISCLLTFCIHSVETLLVFLLNFLGVSMDDPVFDIEERNELFKKTYKTSTQWHTVQKQLRITDKDLGEMIAKKWNSNSSRLPAKNGIRILAPCLAGCNLAAHHYAYARAYRSTTRSAFSKSTSNDDGGGSESDSGGDPPLPARPYRFSLIPPNEKSNSSFLDRGAPSANVVWALSGEGAAA